MTIMAGCGVVFMLCCRFLFVWITIFVGISNNSILYTYSLSVIRVVVQAKPTCLQRRVSFSSSSLIGRLLAPITQQRIVPRTIGLSKPAFSPSSLLLLASTSSLALTMSSEIPSSSGVEADTSINSTSSTTTTTISSSSSSTAGMTHQQHDPLPTTSSTTLDKLMTRANGMIQRTQEKIPLTESEINDILQSIASIEPTRLVMDNTNENDSRHSSDKSNNNDSNSMNSRLRDFLLEIAHLSHKDWSMIEKQSIRFGQILFPPPRDQMNHPDTEVMLQRILMEGKWYDAVQYAVTKKYSQSNNQNNNSSNSNMADPKSSQQEPKSKPFVVLVTGVNGIRKTTSLYQPWFAQALQEAIIVPPNHSNDTSTTNSLLSSSPTNNISFRLEDLPTGYNSFFRQLDHMIATICNNDFTILYRMTLEMLQDHHQQLRQQTLDQHGEKSIESDSIPQYIVDAYSHLKNAIFTRYRTLSELLGAWLLTQAKGNAKSSNGNNSSTVSDDTVPPLNCLLETSGRDVAMFRYVDHFFPTSTYHKLALRFQINSLDQAMTSVDQRMKREIKEGCQLINSMTNEKELSVDLVASQIWVNAGGPYGSHILPQVQKDSDFVWDHQIRSGGDMGEDFTDWYKATIQIYAPTTSSNNNETSPSIIPWTAQAIRPDGTLGTLFEFIPPNVRNSSIVVSQSNARKRNGPHK